MVLLLVLVPLQQQLRLACRDLWEEILALVVGLLVLVEWARVECRQEVIAVPMERLLLVDSNSLKEDKAEEVDKMVVVCLEAEAWDFLLALEVWDQVVFQY